MFYLCIFWNNIKSNLALVQAYQKHELENSSIRVPLERNDVDKIIGPETCTSKHHIKNLMAGQLPSELIDVDVSIGISGVPSCISIYEQLQ